MKYYLFFLTILLYPLSLSAQEDIQIGSLKNFRQQAQGGYFDYSNPDAINIKIMVWGFVRYPGQYIIPSYSSVNDLLALAGGPTENANLDDLRLFRINKDSSQTMIKFDYNDLLWGEDLTKQLKIPNIQAGDIIIVPGEPRFYFKDYFSIALSAVSTLVSVATLLLVIFK